MKNRIEVLELNAEDVMDRVCEQQPAYQHFQVYLKPKRISDCRQPLSVSGVSKRFPIYVLTGLELLNFADRQKTGVFLLNLTVSSGYK